MEGKLKANIDIKFDINKLETRSDLNKDETIDVLSYFLENNTYSNNDETQFNKENEYYVNFNIDKRNKNIMLRSNAKNNDLVCGIVLMAIDKFKQEVSYVNS